MGRGSGLKSAPRRARAALFAAIPYLRNLRNLRIDPHFAVGLSLHAS
jgi:hypothetical protein